MAQSISRSSARAEWSYNFITGTHTNTRTWEIKTQKPYGAVLWFRDNEFDGAIERANTLNAERLEEPKMNPNANHREFWLRSPDGYVVVIAGSYGDFGAP